MTFHADEYQAAAGRYGAGMPYRRVGRSGSTCPPSPSACGTTSATTCRSSASRRRCAGRSTSASPTSTSRTTTARPTARPSATSAPSSRRDFRPYRDELIISTKAGYDMWPGPYGQGGGSRKYLLASLDQSLARLGLDYVDIFYSHRFDETTPLEETMGALDAIVRAGQGAVRRHLVVLRPAHPRGGRDPAVDGHPAAHPPALLLDAQPLDRGGPARRARRRRRRLHRVLPARAGHAHRQVPQGHPRGFACGTGQVARPVAAHRAPRSSTSGRSTGWRRRAASPWPRWPWPGRCATSGSRRCSSARRPSSSSTTASAAVKNLEFSAEELAKIDQHAVDAGINLWKTSSDH